MDWMEELVLLITDEGKWLAGSLGLATVASIALSFNLRKSELNSGQIVSAIMSLFYGVTISIMAFGHLLAVTVELLRGTLREGSLVGFYGIGILLAIPSWWLVIQVGRFVKEPGTQKQMLLILNACTAFSLLLLGLHNLPLAMPAFLNIGFQKNQNRLIGWVFCAGAVVVQLGLLIASLIFMASGKSFEEFSGIE